MKLKNKKTGNITEIEEINLVVMNDERDCYESFAEYHSLAELNADWEDYIPAEPLIKDKKIRNAVRAWAEANEIIKAFVAMDKNMNWIVYGDDIDRNRFMIEFFDRVVSENDETKNCTIDELCGEEDEK